MKIKVSEATPLQLDWAVAKANSIPLCLSPFTGSKQFVMVGQNGKPTTHRYEPTKAWAQGGPIIEREKIGLDFNPPGQPRPSCRAYASNQVLPMDGPTPLVAAMRCYVASKLGDEVEIPEELK